MKRPAIILILVVIHVALLASYGFGAWTLLGIANDPSTLKAADAADEIHGLMIGFWACVVFALLTAIEIWGLWKLKPWSRWAGLVFYGIGAAFVIFGTITDSSFDPEDLVAPIGAAALLALFALPALKRAVQKDSAVAVPTSS